MNLLSIFRRRPAPAPETRSSGSGYTAAIMAAREAWIGGQAGLAETTATVQSCISLWEGGLSMASVEGTDLLSPAVLAMMARSLGLRGESVFLIRDGDLIPAVDWDVRTRNGQPTAYRVSIPEAGGGTSETALAAEIIHVRIGTDPAAPWAGQAPLRRSALSAGLLQTVESALAETFEMAPLGSLVVPFPESPDVDQEALGRSFRGRRGRVLLRESVNVGAAGGPAPATDWRPSDLTPDLAKAEAVQALAAAREAVCSVFGVLPAMLNPAVTGPVVREGQRHLATWTLSPIARLIAAEATDKLGSPVDLDVMSPLQAYDAGGRARALAGAVQAMAAAKEAGLSEGQIAALAAFAGVPNE